MNAMTQTDRLQARKVEYEDLPTYDARELVRDGPRACLVLDGQSYYLRITRAGKLILTK